MNIWFQMLASSPATLQRLIARSNRISLPRRASAEVRLERLRLSLCHARTVRVTYFALAPAEQLALQELRHIRGGLSPQQLADRFGPVRPLSQIARDLKPQSISETLLLHGLVLPRPATNRHPAHFLLPPEVRHWLPRPLALPDLGAAPAPPLAPALRVAIAILLSCAERPLPLRQNGQLTVESLRRLTPRLTPLTPVDLTAVCQFVQPLLIDMGLLASHRNAAALSPQGARFLALPSQTQLNRLRAAWVRAPRVDRWLHLHPVDLRGIDWPLFRRRLLAWAAALPQGRLLELEGLYEALAEAHGPLGDAHTHGYRSAERSPWWPKRAAAVWECAMRGPLTWLGSVAWTDEQRYCFATPTARAEVVDADDEQEATQNQEPSGAISHSPHAWRYGARGEVLIPHAALDAAVLRLLPYARFEAADTDTTSYRIVPRRLALARRDGFAIDALAALLERQAGPLPAEWRDWLDPTPSLRIVYGAVVTSEDPTVLDRAAQARSVRRHLKRLAPGIALADPKRVETLTRALGRQDLEVERHGAPEVARPTDLSAAECSTLLAACTVYRQHALDGVAPDSLAMLEERLRAALPFERRIVEALAPPQPAAGESAATVTAQPADAQLARRSTDTVERGEAAALDQAAPLSRPTVDAEPAQERQPTRGGSHMLTRLPALLVTLVALLPLLVRRRAASHRAPGPHHVALLRPPPGQEPPAPQSVATDELDGARLALLLPPLRHSIARRQPLAILYQAAQGAPSRRIIRPLRLENHAGRWYLQAYCTLRQDERLFRVDRITELREVRLARPRGRPKRVERPEAMSVARRRRVRRRSAPLGAGFFPAPPAASPNSPLVRVWLAD